MAAKVVKQFTGFSGSEIYLMNKHGRLFVRKFKNIQRNLERMQALRNIVPVAEIYGTQQDYLDSEYIHGLDVRSWLIDNPAAKLTAFLTNVIESIDIDCVDKDYTETYKKLFEQIDFDLFVFDQQQLLDRLPKILPSGQYIGDLTLENIIVRDDNEFVLIDCQTSPFDSYVFDLIKLRQDLSSQWFLRYKPAMIELKLSQIYQGLAQRWPVMANDYLLVLSLARITRYCKPGSFEQKFLLKEIDRLWK